MSCTYNPEPVSPHTHIRGDIEIVDRQKILQSFKMSGIAAKLQHNRDKSHGIGSHSQAVKYMNQDFESLRASCLERGRLFEDECFEPLPSSLGFNELGPNSYKVRGVTWKRPTVSTVGRWKHLMQVQACGCSYFTCLKIHTVGLK